MKNQGEKYCKDCGKIIMSRAEICPHCGCRQMIFPFLSEKNRIVAAIFALFLGAFGAHKFYLGQIGSGVLYLLFCWTCIPFLISFCEGLILLGMSDEKFAKKYYRG